MTSINFNIEINYKKGAGHYYYIYEVMGRVKGEKVYYESLQKFTNKEKAENYRESLERTDKDLYKEYDYIRIRKEIIWID